MSKMNDVILDRLLLTEQQIIGQIVAGSSDERLLLEKISDFVARWRGRSWVDSEKIEITGAKLFLSAKPDLWAKIVDRVESDAPNLVATFTDFYRQANERGDGAEDAKWNAPAGAAAFAAKLRLFRTEIDDGRVSGVYEEILRTSNEYYNNVNRGGSINQYLAFLATIMGRLGIRSDREKETRASLIHHLSRAFVTWSPSDEKGWRFIGHAYGLESAYREQEVIAFELVRKFNNVSSWEFLLDFTSQFTDRQDDYFKLSSVPITQGLSSSKILQHRVRSILRQKDISDLGQAPDLVGQLVRMAVGREKLSEEIAIRLFWNVNLLVQQLGMPLNVQIERYASDFIKLNGALQSVEWYAKLYRCGRITGLRIIQQLLSGEPDNAQYLNYKGRLLILGTEPEVSLGIEAIGEALKIGSHIEPSTRDWLAMGLIKRGGRHDVEEAARVLRDNIDLFQNDESRKLLSQLKDQNIHGIIEQCSPRDRLVEVDRIRGIGYIHSATKKFTFTSSKDTQFPLPAGFVEIGTLKKYSALLAVEANVVARRSLITSILDFRGKLDASREVKNYADVLIARYGTEVQEAQSLPSFAAQFEYALNRKDREMLNRISVQYPKLQALCIVGRAMFGDIEAANEVAKFLASPEILPWFDRSVIDNIRFWIANDDGAIVGDVPRLRTRLMSDVIEHVLRAGNESMIKLELAA